MPPAAPPEESQDAPFEDAYADYSDHDFGARPMDSEASRESSKQSTGRLAAPAAVHLAAAAAGPLLPQLRTPHSWPTYDVDGGRQSPFEDDSDYDYDSCCGPEQSLPGFAAQSDSGVLLPADDARRAGDAARDVEMNFVAGVLGRCLDAGFPGRGLKRTAMLCGYELPASKRLISVPLDAPFRFGSA
eukprot:TRINITY_DN22016_c0_g1_i1.p1 TRINITY_DN22016_c0_g1~~TRINITY_DN22016_c0_g1_i1.p1  ORF type:complete len:200 (-),score=47.08 TRINITY_DN22016_c0_g1_i1:147-707(-)